MKKKRKCVLVASTGELRPKEGFFSTFIHYYVHFFYTFLAPRLVFGDF